MKSNVKEMDTIQGPGTVPLPRRLEIAVNEVMKASQLMLREGVIRMLSGENEDGESLRNHMREIASYNGLTIEEFSPGANSLSVEVTFKEIPPHYNPNCIMLQF